MIENGIEDEELISFRFDKNEMEKSVNYIEWIEDDEFRINGEMYDVVKKKVSGDTVYLYCLHDEKESVLLSTIEKLLNQLINDPPKTLNNFNNFINLLSQLYSNPPIQDYILPIGDKYFFPSITYNILDGVYFHITPPPRS